MQIKVGDKYKRVGYDSGYSVPTGGIVIISKVSTCTIVYYSQLDHTSLALNPSTFRKQYKKINKKISLKGIV